MHLIMLLVRRFPIRHLEWPFVRQREDALQQLYFGNGLFDIHTELILSGISRVLKLAASLRHAAVFSG